MRLRSIRHRRLAFFPSVRVRVACNLLRKVPSILFVRIALSSGLGRTLRELIFFAKYLATRLKEYSGV